MAKRYSIKDLAEATDYLAHPVFGKRLEEITAALLEQKGNNTTHVISDRLILSTNIAQILSWKL